MLHRLKIRGEKMDKKIYMYMQIDSDEDKICFNSGKFVGIGRYLLDFIHYNFSESEDSENNKNLYIHPYLQKIPIEKWPLDKIEKFQNIYRAYFYDVIANEITDENAYFTNYRCISGIKLVQKDSTVIAEYMISELEDCLYLEWYEVQRRKLNVKICKNCHRIFMPKKGNIDYCQRIFMDQKTCTQVGYAQTFAKNVKSDELLQAYTRAYKAHYARMTKPRKRAANMTREEFEAWYAQAKAKLILARQGEIDAETFMKWLKE